MRFFGAEQLDKRKIDLLVVCVNERNMICAPVYMSGAFGGPVLLFNRNKRKQTR
jgi:hypothetical protein